MSEGVHSTAFVHPTALLEKGVSIGEQSSIWDNVHIRRDTAIGSHCIVGEKSHISYDVHIGDLVKINAFVYICTQVTLERGVMVSAGCIFTNDRYPRAAEPDLSQLLSSAPDDTTLATVVREGATLGAGAIIGPGLTIGRFAMVGMGSVVTHAVGDFELVFGNPARRAGYVCRCGLALSTLPQQPTLYGCICGRNYSLLNGIMQDLGACEVTAA